MPPKVKMLPVNDIAKLIREHNKLSQIEMPKGKERTRPNLIKAIEDAGYTLNHEKKRIEKGATKQARLKTDPKKDASKLPKKVVISKDKKPSLNTMKIKPKSKVPSSNKEWRARIKDILKRVPAKVKEFKKEATGLKTQRDILNAMRKYKKPFINEFEKLGDEIEELDWFETLMEKNEDIYDEVNADFDKQVDKGFDNAVEELKKGITELTLKDIATKKLVTFTKVEEVKKYFKDFKDKYMDQGSKDGVGGSLRERYIEWIDDNEKRLIKDLQVLQKGGNVKPKPDDDEKGKLQIGKLPAKLKIDKSKPLGKKIGMKKDLIVNTGKLFREALGKLLTKPLKSNTTNYPDYGTIMSVPSDKVTLKNVASKIKKIEEALPKELLDKFRVLFQSGKDLSNAQLLYDFKTKKIIFQKDNERDEGGPRKQLSTREKEDKILKENGYITNQEYDDQMIRFRTKDGELLGESQLTLADRKKINLYMNKVYSNLTKGGFKMEAVEEVTKNNYNGISNLKKNIGFLADQLMKKK